MLAQGLPGPQRGFTITTRDEVRVPGDLVHDEHEWIERAQSDRALNMLDRHIRLTEKSPHPSTCIPRSRQIRIERQRPVDQCNSAFAVVCYARQSEPAEAQCNCVVFADDRSPLR